jgi:hypothetical protein
MRGKKRLSVFITLFLLLPTIFNLLSPYIVNAAVSDDFMTFSQGDERWANETYDAKTGELIGDSGCAITAVAVLMAYANPKLRDVEVFNPKKLADGMYVDNGNMVWSEPASVDPTFTFVSRGSDGSGSSANDTIKKYLDEGKYVVVMTTKQPITGYMHFSPIVGWDASTNKPKVWDVNSGKHTDWSDWETAGIEYFVVYESSLNKSYDVLGKSTGNGAVGETPTEDELQENWARVEEWELVGMHKNSAFWSEMEELIFPDGSDLTTVELENLSSIQSNIDGRKTSFIDYVNLGFTIFGLLLELYVVVLALAYWVDKGISWIDIPFLTVLTFGKYKVWEEEYGVDIGYNSTTKITYCNFTFAVKRLFLIGLFGFFLINKGVFRVVNEIYYFIISHIF